KKSTGLSMKSEVGALDESKTTETFNTVSPKLQACFTKGSQRIPYLAGEIRFVVRILESGAAKWAYVKDSTLGDRKTEECMLGVLTGATWPQPVGGEGVAEKGFTFDAGNDERPPVAWSTENLGKAFEKAKQAITTCRSSSGTAGLKATLYVATNGKPS